jgi:hypothetical protein
MQKHLIAISAALSLIGFGTLIQAQTKTMDPGGAPAASAPMTNKAAQPPGATASGAAKKPAKAGAQSGPASGASAPQ